jgi:hypothetical protein
MILRDSRKNAFARGSGSIKNQSGMTIYRNLIPLGKPEAAAFSGLAAAAQFLGYG